MFIGVGGRRGGTQVIREDVSVKTEERRIAVFSAWVFLAGALQLALMVLVGLALGKMAGPVLLAGAALLSFSPSLYLRQQDGEFGLRFRRREDTSFVRLSRILLLVFGVIFGVLAVAGWMPAIWTWRLTWTLDGYRVLGRWFVADMEPRGLTYRLLSAFLPAHDHWVTGLHILGRLGVVALALWPGAYATYIFRWASNMEVQHPTLSGTPVEEQSADHLVDADGRPYRGSYRDDGDDEEPVRRTRPRHPTMST